MNTLLRITASTALVATLAACGGGGGTSSPAPVTPPPAQTVAPTSTSTADLISFAQSGSLTTLDEGVTRRTRGFTQDGRSGVVVVDQLAGSDIGLVQYRLGNNVSIYRLTGEPVTTAVLPSGTYNGPLDMNYRFDSNSNWSVASGEINLALNFETGELAIGGIASSQNSVIELFGDANVVNNAFADNSTTVRLRDENGVFIRDEVGSVSGVLAESNGNQAIFSLVESTGNATGFEAQGGGTAILFRD